MTKPTVKCARVSFHLFTQGEVAFLNRLSDHPKLGPPRCGSQTRTSLIIKKDIKNKRIETLNTIYEWED